MKFTRSGRPTTEGISLRQKRIYGRLSQSVGVFCSTNPPLTQTHKCYRETSQNIDRKTRTEHNTTTPTNLHLRHSTSSNFFPRCQPVYRLALPSSYLRWAIFKKNIYWKYKFKSVYQQKIFWQINQTRGRHSVVHTCHPRPPATPDIDRFIWYTGLRVNSKSLKWPVLYISISVSF